MSITHLQNEEFKPGLEAGASENGQISSIDGTDLKKLTFFGDDNFCNVLSRNEVMDYGDECFLLKNVITTKECEHFIKESENVGFYRIDVARDDYRSSQRISFKSPELATLLWQRIQSYLKTISISGDPREQHIEGVDSLLQGTWVPRGLNDVFRLCRYFPGGHFAPHCDGFFMKSSTERSLQTFMLYLNGDFSGGCTNFVDPEQKLYKGPDGKYCAQEENILYHVKPERGMAIIFNHNRLHEGERLKDGIKYILRSDIMFENTKAPLLSTEQEKALKLLQEADRLETQGKCMEAMQLYRKAYKLFPDLDQKY